MKALEEIWADRRYEREPTYTRHLGLMEQPTAYAAFGAHPEFAEAMRLVGQEVKARALDLGRVWSMILNIKHAAARCPGAAFAELGVWRGCTAALIALYAKELDRKMYLADTFAGFPQAHFEPGMGEGKENAFKDTTLDIARQFVGDYPGNRWIVGMFPDAATAEMRDERFAFVSIDVDLYLPVLEGLRFFWPRMAPGGIVFVHDYSSGHWPGATRAVDEFCAGNGIAGIVLPDAAGSYALARQPG